MSLSSRSAAMGPVSVVLLTFAAAELLVISWLEARQVGSLARERSVICRGPVECSSSGRGSGRGQFLAPRLSGSVFVIVHHYPHSPTSYRSNHGNGRPTPNKRAFELHGASSVPRIAACTAPKTRPQRAPKNLYLLPTPSSTATTPPRASSSCTDSNRNN